MTYSLKSAVAAGFAGAILAIAATLAAAKTGLIDLSSGAGIRAYILAHPEILAEAQTKLQQQQDALDDAARQAAVDRIGLKPFFDSKLAFITGPPVAKTTIVEFFDYNCPYCRASLPAMKKFYEQHRNARFAFIEFPIKGAQSTIAARAALAARKQPDKYMAFHFALMGEEGLVDENTLFADAQKAGLNVSKLRADMQASEVDTAIAAAHALAQRVGIDGTPAFIVNGRIREGAVDDALLKQMTKG